MIENLFHNPIALVLIQAVIIVPFARGLGTLFSKIRQPMVIGEIIAGLLLGPSFLGWIAPDAYHFLFPASSLGFLNVLSQIGLIFFMFLVGLEFNPKVLRGQAHTAVATSHASILFPFILGALLALYLYPKLSDNSVRFTSFALFMGASMSVTAFPVLARILTEHNLIRTRLGTMALTCAAIDDISAWLILAFVISVVRATGSEQILTVLLWTSLYLILMVALVRPLLRRFERRFSTREGLSQNAVAAVIIMLLLSALTTELIGIHALFGAFFLGAIMPNETSFVRNLTEKIEDIAVLFLLPLFFASTGLKTQVGLVSSPELWLLTLVIVLVACVGKFGGSFFVAKLTGLSWRESAAMGILVNTRGLMELVILNIGFDLGVISPLLFTMLVLMALITTFMTTPLLGWVYPEREILAELGELSPKSEKRFTMLVSVSLPRSASGLISIAGALRGSKAPAKIYALHLVRTSERPSNYVKGQENRPEIDPIIPVIAQAKELNLEVRPLTFFTNDPGEDIVDVAQAKNADLILMGWHKPLFGGTKLGGTVRDVMRDAPCPVAIFIDRGLKHIHRVLVPTVKSPHDATAMLLAKRIAASQKSEVTILHIVNSEENENTPSPPQYEDFIDPETQMPTRLITQKHPAPADLVLEESAKNYDLVIVGVSEEFELERRLFGLKAEKIAERCPVSMLIVQGDLSNGSKII